LCCVFVLFFFVMCTLCCPFLWIVHFWLSLRYSLKIICFVIRPPCTVVLVHWQVYRKTHCSTWTHYLESQSTSLSGTHYLEFQSTSLSGTHYLESQSTSLSGTHYLESQSTSFSWTHYLESQSSSFSWTHYLESQSSSLSGIVANTNFIVFTLTRSWIKLTISHNNRGSR
jgi:nitrate reductase cytochrome c-type subunit